MITIRRSEERGHFQHGWLDTYHTFSFDQYRDPEFTNFRSLRVINEDHVAPAQGFGMHPHRDMEIITYVLDGALKHKDSMGNASIIKPGDGQRMSAGTGVLHSEFNPSTGEPVHLLQIWIMPEKKGITPSYEQKEFPSAEKRGKWRVIASNTGEQGSVTINQDVKLYVAELLEAEQVTHTLATGRHAWVQVAKGAIELNGSKLRQGDGAAISDEDVVTVKSLDDTTEVLLFDLA
jgi:redox-sensitive bicupin YhaK (pirin superfamily)